MKIYAINPAVARPHNVAHIANAKSVDDATAMIRLMNVISHPIIDTFDKNRCVLVTSDNPDEPQSFVIAPDKMRASDLAMNFDADPETY